MPAGVSVWKREFVTSRLVVNASFEVMALLVHLLQGGGRCHFAEKKPESHSEPSLTFMTFPVLLPFDKEHSLNMNLDFAKSGRMCKLLS